MKTKHTTFFLALLFLIPGACGSTSRTVQYVYVDRPVYESESAQIQAISKAKRESAPQRGPVAATGVTAGVAAGTAPSQAASAAVQSPRQRIRKLAEQAPEGYMRGYGSYINEDEDYAIDMAKAQALRTIATQAVTRIRTSLDMVKSGEGKVSSTKGKVSIEELAVTYQITKWRVLESHVSDGPMYEAIYCLEVPTSNIVEYLQPVLNAMSEKERTQVINHINRGY